MYSQIRFPLLPSSIMILLIVCIIVRVILTYWDGFTVLHATYRKSNVCTRSSRSTPLHHISRVIIDLLIFTKSFLRNAISRLVQILHNTTKSSCWTDRGIPLRILKSFVTHSRLQKIFAGMIGLLHGQVSLLQQTCQDDKEICQDCNVCWYEAAIHVASRYGIDTAVWICSVTRTYTRLASIGAVVADR